MLPEFNNFIAPRNEPEPDRGGELTSQSYDVRANTVEPVQDAQTEIPTKFDNWWNEVKKPYTPHFIPNEEPSEISQKEPGFWSKLGTWLKNESVKPYHGVSLGNEVEKAKNAFKEDYQFNVNPETYNQIPNLQKHDEVTPKEENQGIKEKMESAQENPSSTVVYGATDEVANQPNLKAKFKEYTGMNFDDQIKKNTKEYEKVLSDLQDNNNQEMNGYTEQEKRINERILSNQANDTDKFFIGLALLMPLVMGAAFGKEVGLGVLGGAAKGVSDVYGNRQKDTMENEKLLADLANKKSENLERKSNIELKKLSIPQEVRKNLPKDEKEYLIGKKEVSWLDPETGKEKNGVQIKPNLIAYPEYVADKEELKEMRAEAKEITKAITPMKEINKLTDDIIEISSQLDDKDKSFIQDAFANYLAGKEGGIATKIGKPVEFQGRKVNSYVVLEHKIKLLVDAYRQAKGMRALTESVKDHIEGLFRNPASSFQSYNDTIDQMLFTRDLAQDRLLNTVDSNGFAREFVIEDLQPQVRKTFNKLNYKEGEKESSELLKDI